jgi:transcriptional regulator with XRE-family HTH domain
VSAILISKLESNEREPSKQLIKSLAARLDVTPFSLSPFLTGDAASSFDSLSGFEKRFYELGMKIQKDLVTNKAKNLLKHVS